MRSAATWAGSNDIAQISDVALLKRLRGAADWLGEIAGALLPTSSSGVHSIGSRRLCIADANSISGCMLPTTRPGRASPISMYPMRTAARHSPGCL